MRGRRAAVVLTLAAFTGCASMRENPNLCKVATIGTGALLGATAGGLISGVAADHGDSGGSKNWEIGLSTAGGTAVGGLAGALLAHMICKEPEPEPVAAPPPPPPPPSGTKIATIPGPNFAFDKSTLTAEGRSRVATAAATHIVLEKGS